MHKSIITLLIAVLTALLSLNANIAHAEGGDTPSGIYGTVTFNGAPASSLRLRLVRHVSSTDATQIVSETDTDASGSYLFSELDSLDQAQSYYVVYRNSADPERVRVWFGPVIDSYTSGESIHGGDFDVADVSLKEPAWGSYVEFPETFSWEKRSFVGDTYRLVLFDWFYGELWRSSDLGYVDSQTINSVPQGFLCLHCAWTVEVYSGLDSFGVSFQHHVIGISIKTSRINFVPIITK